MRKKLFLLLLLVACIALSGCALVVKDPVRDAQQVIDNTVQELVLKQKFAALPELAFTEEDEKAIAEEAQKEYDQNIDQVKTMYLSDSGKEGDELTAAAQEYALKLDSRYTLDFVKEHVREEKMVEKLREYAIKDVAVTEDDIKAEFDSRVASAKENYESNLSSFGSSVNSNGTVYYRPAGYRYVKQILVGFPDDLKIQKLVQPDRVEYATENIAGVEVPNFRELTFKDIDYSVDDYPLWVDYAVVKLRDIARLDAVCKTLAIQEELLEKELRSTSQRVNLFEKVKIPEAIENIRVIEVYLGDQQTAAVVRGKIAKKKLTEAAK